MRKIYLFIVALVLPLLGLANNIRITSSTLTGQNTSAGVNNPANHTFVQFNLAWDNSWRTNSGPANYDAAWVFVKYKIDGGTGCTATGWQHATLSNVEAEHDVNGNAATIKPGAAGNGVFIYRNANGVGNVNFSSLKLRWNYGSNGVLDNCNVTVKIFAIEMVHVPQGSFSAGDGSLANLAGQFESGVSSLTFSLASENALTLGGGTGSLGNNNAANQVVADDFNDATTRTLPAAFPKGFNAFFAMKYEISQEQYVEFLNTLTGTQQASRTTALTAGSYMAATTGVTIPSNRNGIRCRIAPVGAQAGEYGCDLNNNGIYNESADGQNIACNFLTWMDAAAYMDWAALRPMTELEFEKACRGSQVAVPGEYAWGNATSPGTIGSINNSGAADETVSSGNAQNVAGTPLRCGIFATASSNRSAAGAAYFGLMEMSGNLGEWIVSTGSVAGRSYTGLHGNGTLLANGNADVDFWPGINGNSSLTAANTVYSGNGTGVGNAAGSGVKNTGSDLLIRVSDRSHVNWGVSSGSTRQIHIGFRGARTAP